MRDIVRRRTDISCRSCSFNSCWLYMRILGSNGDIEGCIDALLRRVPYTDDIGMEYRLLKDGSKRYY